MMVPDAMQRRSPNVISLLGVTAVAGTLDMAFAMTFWGLRGVAPTRILKSVASGLLGRDAFAGGAATAMLGLALHYAIILLMVIAYERLALRLRWPMHHAWLAGPLYGCVLYVVMTFVVVPLSAATSRFGPADWVIGSILAHTLLVGLPCALLVRRMHVTPAIGSGGGGGCVDG